MAAIVMIVTILVYPLYFGCSDQNECPSPFTPIRHLVHLSPTIAEKYNQKAAFPTSLFLGVTMGIIRCHSSQSLTFIYDRWAGLLTAAFSMSMTQEIGCCTSLLFGDQLPALGEYRRYGVQRGKRLQDEPMPVTVLTLPVVPRQLVAESDYLPTELVSMCTRRTIPGRSSFAIFSMACKQYFLRGGLIASVIFTFFSHLLYFGDAIYNEVRRKERSTFTR
jgi:hypothetical protein